MIDRLREDLPRLVQAAAGIEHVVDLGPVLGPFFDLVEVAVVRNQRVVGLFDGLVAHSGGSYFGGRSGILGADDFARFEVARRPGRFAVSPEVHLYCGCKP